MFSSFASRGSILRKVPPEGYHFPCRQTAPFSGMLSHYAEYAVRKRGRKTFFSFRFLPDTLKKSPKPGPFPAALHDLNIENEFISAGFSRYFPAFPGRARMNRIYKRACFGLR